MESTKGVIASVIAACVVGGFSSYITIKTSLVVVETNLTTLNESVLELKTNVANLKDERYTREDIERDFRLFKYENGM